MTDVFGIRFESETKGLKDSGKAIEKMAKAADKADDSVEKLNKELKKTGKSGSVAAKGAGALEMAAKKTTGAFKLQKNSAQQLGYQLQDVAVTAQMGVSWFTILGQQGSQLAGVFGSGGALFGAVIAIGAAIGGVLYKAMGKVSETSDELKDRINALGDSFEYLDEAQKKFLSQKLSSEVESQVDKMNRLAKESAHTTSEIKRLNKAIAGYKKEVAAFSTGPTNLFYGNLIAKSQKQVKKLREELVKTNASWVTGLREIGIKSKENGEINEKFLDGQVKSMLDAINILGKQEQIKSNAIATGIRGRKEELALENKLNDSAKTSLFLNSELMASEIKKGKIKQAAINTKKNNSFEAQLASLADFGKSESDIEQQRYDESLKMLESYAEDKGWLDAKIRETELLLEADHQEKILGIQEKSQKKKGKIQATTLENVASIANIYSSLEMAANDARRKSLENELSNSKNLTTAQIKNKEHEARELFKIQKDASLASIVASTSVGVMAQLAMGNWIAAAEIGASGVANYSAVNSTKYNSPASISGSAPTAPPSVNNTSNSGGNIVNIEIMNSGGGSVDAESLKEWLKNDGVLFESDSAQAQALR